MAQVRIIKSLKATLLSQLHYYYWYYIMTKLRLSYLLNVNQLLLYFVIISIQLVHQILLYSIYFENLAMLLDYYIIEGRYILVQLCLLFLSYSICYLYVGYFIYFWYLVLFYYILAQVGSYFKSILQLQYIIIAKKVFTYTTQSI